MIYISGLKLEDVIPIVAMELNKRQKILLYDVVLEVDPEHTNLEAMKWMEPYYHFFLKDPQKKYNHIVQKYYANMTADFARFKRREPEKLSKKTLMFTNTEAKKCIGMFIFEEKTLKIFFRASFIMPTMYYDLVVLNMFLESIKKYRQVNKVLLYFNKVKINNIYGLPFTDMMKKMFELSPYFDGLNKKWLSKVDDYSKSNNFQRSRVYRRYKEEFLK